MTCSDMVRLINPPIARSSSGQSHSAVLVNDHEKRIEAELDQLQKDIRRVGSNPGEPSVLFGELFDDEEVEQYYEALVGTLKCAKKRRIISFKGQMLLKGMHDDVEIALLDSEEQKTAAEQSVPAGPKPALSQSLPVNQTSPRDSPAMRRGLQPVSLTDSQEKKTEDLLTTSKPSESEASQSFKQTPPIAAKQSLSATDSEQKHSEESEMTAKSATTQSLPSVQRTPPRAPAFKRTPPKDGTQSSDEEPSDDPVTRANTAETQSSPSLKRTPPRVRALKRTPSRGGTQSVTDRDEPPTEDQEVRTEPAKTQTLSSVKRTPPRAPAFKRTPSRGGTPSLPAASQTPPRPPASFDQTTLQGEEQSFPPGVRRITTSLNNFNFSPLRHTRNEHSSLKIPQAFSKDYTSDSEAEFSSRRARELSMSSGASSDTEAEVTTRRHELENKKNSLPLSNRDAELCNSVDKVLTTRRATSKGSVPERWTKRSPVSKIKGNEKGKTEGQRRPVAHKSRRASSVNEKSSSVGGSYRVLNKENRMSQQSRTEKDSVAMKKTPHRKTKSMVRISGTGGAVAATTSLHAIGGSNFMKGPTPSASSRAMARAKSEKVIRPSPCIRVDEEVEQLLRDICRVGSNPGEPRVTFGELFDDDIVQNTYEALVGTLRSAKRQGLIRFDGQMLFKGMHDNVMIEIVTK